MKLTKDGTGNKRTHKQRKPKIHWRLLGLPDPAEGPKSISMDEVRHQVVLMSSRGFGEAVRSRPSTQSVKAKGRNEHARSRRGATE